MITTSFKEDLLYIKGLLETKTPFAISRYGDGEAMIMAGTKLNLLHKNEFNFNGQLYLQQDLINSFQHNQQNYFVGIACPCCVGYPKYLNMKNNTMLPDKRLTWANIFVNANYTLFRTDIVPIFSSYKTTLTAQGVVNNLPFDVSCFHLIGPDAWINNADVYEDIRQQILTTNANNELFLFCAGPFACILVQKLYSEFPNNTYIDIGSVFNIELGIGSNRGYLAGGATLNKTCIWS